MVSEPRINCVSAPADYQPFACRQRTGHLWSGIEGLRCNVCGVVRCVENQGLSASQLLLDMLLGEISVYVPGKRSPKSSQSINIFYLQYRVAAVLAALTSTAS